MNYMMASSTHSVSETQSTVIIARKKKSRCDAFRQVVEAVLIDHPEALTHIDSESGSYDKVIVLK